jgi:hypothetical protein
MRLITCNALPVLGLRLMLPRTGVWTAALELDAEEAVTGAVEILDEGVSYVGTVVSSGVLAGVCRAEVVGGAGGFRKDVPSRSYVGVTARTVLADLMAAVGERLDAQATRTVLAAALPYWTRAAGRAGTAMQDLADALGASWRVLPGGNVWMGQELWSEAEEGIGGVEMDRDDGAGTVVLAPDTIGLAPGVTLEGRRVGRVEHFFAREAPLRTTFWVEAA